MQEPGEEKFEEKALRVPRRRRAYRVDPKVLEARLAQRYEMFVLPRGFKSLFKHLKNETDWAKLAELAHP